MAFTSASSTDIAALHPPTSSLVLDASAAASVLHKAGAYVWGWLRALWAVAKSAAQLYIKLKDNLVHLEWMAIVIAALIGYSQYLQNSNSQRIEAAELAYSRAVAAIDGVTPVGRRANLRILRDLAFASFPLQPATSWYTPFVSLRDALLGRRERRFLARSRLVLADVFESSKAKPLAPADGSALLPLAAEWIRAEAALRGEAPSGLEFQFLAGTPLPGITAPGLQLTGMYLAAVELEGAHLAGARLDSIYGPSIRLDSADLNSAHFEDAKLVQSSFVRAHLDYSHFERADLSHAKLDSCDCALAHFDHATLVGAVARRASLRSAILADADLSGADFRHSDFSQADLEGADFSGSDLRGADLRFSVGLQAVRSWAHARLEGAMLPLGFSPNTHSGDAK